MRAPCVHRAWYSLDNTLALWGVHYILRNMHLIQDCFCTASLFVDLYPINYTLGKLAKQKDIIAGFVGKVGGPLWLNHGR